MGLDLKAVVSVRRVLAGMLCVAGCVGLGACGGGSKVTADASTPKKAMAAIKNAMFSGDVNTLHALTTGTAEEVKAVDGMATFMAASQRLTAAAKAKFGDVPEMGPTNDGTADIDAMTETDNGDTATLAKAGDAEPHTLKKVGGIWKMDLSGPDVHNHLAEFTAMAPMAAGMNEVADGIAAGKYKTKEEMQADVMAKMTPAGPK